MTKRLIVFGNGLGRAIDNTFFSLETALSKAWESGVIDAEKKAELCRWAILEKNTAPKTEEQFGRIFVVMREAAILREESLVSTIDLTEADIRSFCHAAACHFHKFSATPFDVRLDDFIDALRNHRLINQSSIATLNYDKLIYGAMVKAGFDDGFRGKEPPVFKSKALNEAIRQEEGLYLHLHGSPLFMTSQNERSGDQIEKKPTGQIPKISGSSQSHLILNNSYFKQADIEKSALLSSYWKAYRALVAKADRIILFGYSGCDDHLNATINLLGKGNVTRVVEREWDKERCPDGKNIKQGDYWDMVIPGSEVITMPDILKFRDWGQ